MFVEAGMKISRRVVTAGTTFFLAAATGYVMQNGSSPISMRTAEQPAAAQANLTLPADTPIVPLRADLGAMGQTTIPDLPQTSGPTLADTTALSARMRALAGRTAAAPEPETRLSAFGLVCAPSEISVTADKNAILQVVLDAPCHENTAVTLTHAGIDVTIRTDLKGHLSIAIPAFDAKGAVSAKVGSDETLAAEAQVKGLDKIARLAVVSPATQRLALNVFESGAKPGGAGHLTALHPVNTRSKRGGHMLSLGDSSVSDGYVTEIYEYSRKTKAVRMEIAADATPDVCGETVNGRMVETMQGAADSHDLELAMPPCDGLGGTLVMALTPGETLTVASTDKN